MVRIAFGSEGKIIETVEKRGKVLCNFEVLKI